MALASEPTSRRHGSVASNNTWRCPKPGIADVYSGQLVIAQERSGSGDTWVHATGTVTGLENSEPSGNQDS